MTRLRPLLGFMLVLGGCSSPYDIRLSDDKSASNGPLFFFGWTDPPLLPGLRLADAPSGSRVVLWDESGLEAIVDLGETCPVLVREGDGARAPTDLELELIAAVFPGWDLAASIRVADYADERRLERRFPSHIRSHVEKLAAPALVEFALGDAPAGWLSLGGRVFALSRGSAIAPPATFGRILNRALALEGEGRRSVLRALLARPELNAGDLVKIARVEAPLAVAHPAATEEVCLAAIETVAKEPLSSSRRRGLEAVLASPGATPAVRAKALEVPLAYPEDREAIRAKALK